MVDNTQDYRLGHHPLSTASFPVSYRVYFHHLQQDFLYPGQSRVRIAHLLAHQVTSVHQLGAGVRR